MTRKDATAVSIGDERILGVVQTYHTVGGPILKMRRPAHSYLDEIRQAAPEYVRYDPDGWRLFWELVGHVLLIAGLTSGLLLVIMGYGGYTGFSALMLVLGMAITGVLHVTDPER
jgi:hypothetical protein